MRNSFILLSILAAAAFPAGATLGGSAESVLIDQSKFFGVSWAGSTIPDLAQLLGVYNTEFQNTLRSKAGRRKIAIVRNSDLVVESAGHTRAFHGRAYLNSILPIGVTEEVVQ
jgi:hypothetical protein